MQRQQAVVTLLGSLWLVAPVQAGPIGDAWNKAKEKGSQGMQKIKENARERGENLQQRYEQKQQQFQTQKQQVIEQAKGRFQHLSEGQRQAMGQSLERLYSRDERQANQLVEALQRFGPKSGEALTQCFEKYGQAGGAATQRILANVSNHSEAARERMLAAYRDHGLELGDKVAGCYSRYARHAPGFADGLGALYLDKKDELATRLDRLAATQKLEQARSVLAYYSQNQNQRVAGLLCEFQLKHGERLRNDLCRITDRVVAEVRDPQNQDRAIECAIKAIEIYNDRQEFTTQAAKSVLQHVSVTTRDGETMNAEQLLQREIVRQWPYLAGTTIAEDPVRCLTYGVIYKDKDFLFNDLKVLPGPQGAMSANEALGRAIHADPAQTIAVLDKMEAWTVIAGGESTPEETAEAVAILAGGNGPERARAGT
jgi:hypothetical protein